MTAIFKENIIGAKSWTNVGIMGILLLGGIAFFFTGISSYFHLDLLPFTTISQIAFFPQGIIMLFYGAGGIALSFYIFLSVLWDLGGGYNEFSKSEKLVRIVRKSFPGKNAVIFLSYDINNIKSLKLLTKQGINPRCTILLVLKDKREIPLYPSQSFLSVGDTEKKALFLAEFLNLPLESFRN